MEDKSKKPQVLPDREQRDSDRQDVGIDADSTSVDIKTALIDGIPDVIRHRENGWLCNEKDPTDLADKILEALDEPDDSHIRRKGADTADGLDWSAVAAHYARVFGELADTGGS